VGAVPKYVGQNLFYILFWNKDKSVISILLLGYSTVAFLYPLSFMAESVRQR
jgi:hypothetical protein